MTSGRPVAPGGTPVDAWFRRPSPGRSYRARSARCWLRPRRCSYGGRRYRPTVRVGILDDAVSITPGSVVHRQGDSRAGGHGFVERRVRVGQVEVDRDARAARSWGGRAAEVREVV